ncbi:MAG: stage III sporulation protein AE [Lachnospiraceae bacterium]|nr:stage III sporulation protein AE [Lachnospiraceae bacterium]
MRFRVAACFFLFSLSLFLLSPVFVVEAEDAEEGEQSEHVMLTYMEETLAKEFRQWERLCRAEGEDSLIKRLLNGEQLSFENARKKMVQAVKEQFSFEKETLFRLLFLGVLSGFFANFENLTLRKYIGETGYYVIYMLLLMLLMVCFKHIYSDTVKAMEGLLGGIQTILPVYVFSLFLSGNIQTASGSYLFLLTVITAVDVILKKIILPLIYFYFVLTLMDHSMQELKFSRLSSFLKSVIVWLMRFLFGAVTGMQVVQCLLLPATDRAKASNFSKSLAAIPGLGSSARALTGTLLQSANVLKQTLGVAAMILILLLVLVPAVKLLFVIGSYQLVAALLQPVAHPKVSSLIASLSSSAKLLFQAVLSSSILFLILIALVTASSQAGG